MVERRAARGVFDPRALTPTGLDGEEGIQTGLVRLTQGGGSLGLERRMDFVPHLTDETLQRLKRWQLKTLLHQMLNSHINSPPTVTSCAPDTVVASQRLTSCDRS